MFGTAWLTDLFVVSLCRHTMTLDESFGAVRAFGIEGTGSYGAGLACSRHAASHTVQEAGRPVRGLRHRHGKTDHLDAEGAARAVLAGKATALPKAGTARWR